MKRTLYGGVLAMLLAGNGIALANPQRQALPAAANLLQQAASTIPTLCQDRHQPARCRQAHYRAAQTVADFIQAHPAPHNTFHYRRCSQSWLTAQSMNFVRFAQCMGLPES